ncbi:primase-helicase family protein [Salmonirosea aquatica]|uniref:NrS-1 polymerase-like helicase domain-containing protein n=1 Tax=Salmonirosea aquatica TaxID=2654236 RepID=A0A7C9BDJ8_9BACT|nr:hypothetical protein [Cytophagaceae bacterium SJW1-29]
MSKNIKENAKQFIRVGDDYYKITLRPDKKGNLHRVLAKRQKRTITDDYGANIIHEIAKYEDFVIVPSHVNYQQIIHGHYNKYYEISHKPKKGSFKTITAFLAHIFGEEYLDFIMDYFQLLYLKPTQSLPIILLESVEKNTGKSTFGHFVEKIFQFNSIALGNSDFNSQFNSVWIDKLTIIVDETSLEEKAVMESIKRLSTEKGKVLSNSKGKDKVDIEFIGKFIFISNDEGKALPIQRGEKRFAVFKVPTFASRGIEDNPDILDDLQAEIPAFLHYLKGRQLVHPTKSRMHFDTAVYFTRQLELYFEGSQGHTTKAIQELVKDSFEAFPEETSLSFSESDLIEEMEKGNYNRYIDRRKVKEALQKDLGLIPHKKGRYTYFSLHRAEQEETYYPVPNKANNVYYTFLRNNYKDSYENNTIEPKPELEQMAVF